MFGTERLVPALSEFSQRYPLIDLYVVLGNERMDLVDSGFDVAIRLGELGTSSLIARPMQPYTLTLCASPAYLARRGTPRTRRTCNNMTAWRSPTLRTTTGVTPTNCGA